MPETNLQALEVSDLTNQISDFEIVATDTEGTLDQPETSYNNTDWQQQWAYYEEIPELATAVDAKANWTVGAGFQASKESTVLLSGIKGNGKDTFNSILENQIVVAQLAGDSYAEIIRDPKSKVVINLKPLNPGTIWTFGTKGRITRYEQRSRIGDKVHIEKFNENEIFHLSRNRRADSMRGQSVVRTCEKIILMRNEAMDDWKRVLHRNVEPLWIFHLDTDDETTIAAMQTKYNTARKSGENMFIPKGAVVPEIVSTASNAALNPLQWIDRLNDYFFQAVNVPQIIIGNSKEFTDASGKIVYLAYEQSVKKEQLYVEEQVLDQLGFEIQLTFPASLQQDLLTGEQKQPLLQSNTPNDTTAELEGRT